MHLPIEGGKYSTIGHPWLPGKWKRIPWGSVCLLLGSLLGLTAATLILVFSDGSTTSSWTFRPAVYLSVSYSITNTLLAAALAQGATIAWWRRASGASTTLEDLHNCWAFSGDMKEALFAGRKTNLMAIAALLVAIAPVNGPLFQRATTIHLRDAALTGRKLYVPAVKTYTAGSGMSGFLMPDFEPVARAFLDRDDITLAESGCPTNGTCTGRLEAAGLAIKCENSTLSFNNTLISGTATGYFNDIFSTGFYRNVQSPPYQFNLSMRVKDTSDCQGVLLEKECVLRLATVRYPVRIDGTREIITLERGTTMFDDEFVSNSPEPVIGETGEPILAGVLTTLNGQYASQFTMRKNGTLGFSIQTTNSAMLARFADYRGIDLFAGLNSSLLPPNTCQLRFNDPFGFILNNTRELMFRKALADADSSHVQAVTVDIKTTIYQTDYSYLALAVTITLLAMILVTATFYGYWELGREVSMSPLEIAKAFNAPLLAGEDSNSDSKGLVRSAGHKAVRYGVVTESVELETLAGMKGQDVTSVRQSGVSSRFLGIAERGVVEGPRAGEQFRA